METIIGKINGVSLECTPSLPIVENIDHIYQFIWDDSNLDNTIWKSKDFSGGSILACFKNSRSKEIYGQILAKNGEDKFYCCEVPGSVLEEPGYLFISIIRTTDKVTIDSTTGLPVTRGKRMITAEMEKPLSILKAGAHTPNEHNQPYIRSAIEKITQNLSDKDRSTKDMILTKLSEEDYDFGWSDKFEGTSRHVFTESSESGTILGSYFVEEIKDEEGNLIGEKTKIGRTELTYEENTLIGNLKGDTNGSHTGPVKGDVTGSLFGNADTATQLKNPRNILIKSPYFTDTLASFDGTANIEFNLEFKESTKIPAYVLPDFVLGQMVYGGTFNGENYQVSLTTDSKSKLNVEESTIILNENDYKQHEGIYYIVENSGTFGSLAFEVGDWLISTEVGWKKIDNTDQVTSVNGQQGQVILTPKDVGAYTPTEVDNLIISHNNDTEAHANGIIGNAATATEAQHSLKADELTISRTINGINFSGASNIGNFGICSTEKTNSNKLVSIPNFNRQVGSLAIVKFEYTDGSSNLTLNISDTGAAPIYSGGVPIGTGRIKAGYSYIFVFDGVNYILISALESCTEESKLITYAELSVSPEGTVEIPNTISDNEGWDRAVMVFDQLGNYMIQGKDYTVYSENSKYYFNIINPAADTGISICYLKTSALEELTLESILVLLDNEHQFVTQQEKDNWNSIDLDLTIEDIDAVLDTNHRFVSDADIERWNSIDLDLTLSDIEEVLDDDHQLVSATEKEKWNNSLAEQGTELWIFECGTSSTNIDK